VPFCAKPKEIANYWAFLRLAEAQNRGARILAVSVNETEVQCKESEQHTARMRDRAAGQLPPNA